MLKQNKRSLILSSIITLLPVLIGFLLWDRLPEQMTTHWGFDGNPDGWSGKLFAVVALPLILLASQWLCILITAKDPKNKNQNSKVFRMVLWIMPVVSVLMSSMTYALALGWELEIGTITFGFIGLIFVIIGNYLPKCKQNHTIGVKLKWTLENEENWNVTHRVTGKVWVIGGLAMMACMFLPGMTSLVVITILMTVLILVPCFYSYAYHKKQVKKGNAVFVPLTRNKASRTVTVVSLVSTAVILVAVAVVCFTGDIGVVYGEESFTIEASFWQDLTVKYSAIDSVEYREEKIPGVRTFGFGSPRLSMGTFQNEEFGSYTRYTYTGKDSCVVLDVKGKILVLGGKDAESTKTIYEQLNQLK